MERKQEQRNNSIESQKRSIRGVIFIFTLIVAFITGCNKKASVTHDETPLPKKDIIEQDNEQQTDSQSKKKIENKNSTKKEEAFSKIVHEDNLYQWLISPSDNTDTYGTPLIRYSFIRQNKETKERLLLDDLLWEEITLNKPVVFTGKRFIYTAAEKDTMISLKEPSLISIKPDGTDRKYYKPLYGTANALCYDNGLLYYEGWSNDNKFPKPIYTLTPDLKKDTKIQDINGILLTVNKGILYYLSNDKDKPGIYTLKLGKKEEPEIFDKVGNMADEFILKEAVVKNGKLYVKLKSLKEDSFMWEYKLDLFD